MGECLQGGSCWGCPTCPPPALPVPSSPACPLQPCLFLSSPACPIQPCLFLSSPACPIQPCLLSPAWPCFCPSGCSFSNPSFTRDGAIHTNPRAVIPSPWCLSSACFCGAVVNHREADCVQKGPLAPHGAEGLK
uniref:Uncharacterized protein n=1 Tax=Zonotrichia albicollis TaxID=44394 RepID=A0A8D2NCS8_ZONAL